MKEAVHETADGRRLLVIHGDQFDGVIAYARWLALLGDWAYTLALQLSEVVNAARRSFGLPYWSLSAYLKQKVKNAVEFICRFEEAVARDVHRKGLDGVVCGHIHHAAISRSTASPTTMTATGLKAAPPLSKMPADIWRFSTGQPAAQRKPQRRRRAAAARPLPPFPPEPLEAARHDAAHRRGVAGAVRRRPETLERILIVTDAWAPQVNGVVRTLEILGRDLAAMGHEVRYATPEGRFTAAACPPIPKSGWRCFRAGAWRR